MKKQNNKIGLPLLRNVLGNLTSERRKEIHRPKNHRKLPFHHRVSTHTVEY